MWSEARKQEKKLRGMMIDYKKRAERRREYYDKIKTDPAQFMQVRTTETCRIARSSQNCQSSGRQPTRML